MDHDEVCDGRQPLSGVARTFKSVDVRGRPVERMVPCLLVDRAVSLNLSSPIPDSRVQVPMTFSVSLEGSDSV